MQPTMHAGFVSVSVINQYGLQDLQCAYQPDLVACVYTFLGVGGGGHWFIVSCEGFLWGKEFAENFDSREGEVGGGSLSAVDSVVLGRKAFSRQPT